MQIQSRPARALLGTPRITCARRGTIGYRNQAPLFTATRTLRPNTTSPAARAPYKAVSEPVIDSAIYPPPSASTNLRRPLQTGQSRRPAPCEAKYLSLIHIS